MKRFLEIICTLCVICAAHYYIGGDVSRATFFAVIATFVRPDIDNFKSGS